MDYIFTSPINLFYVPRGGGDETQLHKKITAVASIIFYAVTYQYCCSAYVFTGVVLSAITTNLLSRYCSDGRRSRSYPTPSNSYNFRPPVSREGLRGDRRPALNRTWGEGVVVQRVVAQRVGGHNGVSAAVVGHTPPNFVESDRGGLGGHSGGDAALGGHISTVPGRRFLEERAVRTLGGHR